ncbi:peptidoglycan bridge formation glycyltransferase FemA/FemB family protein [Candidatus Saccharibacteria bacterium]|nr:peptidoglycan bridge formation glycyltransferase FemA/FemB family protein [Candidatus Saccharibacteria bacterium]
MRVAEISGEEYRDFVERQKMDNFLQSAEMFSRYQKIGKESYLLGGFEGDKLVVAGLAVKMREKLGKKIYNMPRGPIWDDTAPESLEVLQSFLGGVERILKAKGGMVLQISPNVWRKRRTAAEDEKETKKGESEDVEGGKNDSSGEKVENGLVVEDWPEGEQIRNSLVKRGFKDLGEYEQVKWAYILELEGKTPEDILMNFRYSHRRNVRLAAEKYGIKVRELNDDEIHVLKEITEQTGERRGFKDPEVKYYKDMKEAFGDKVKFMVAEYEGKPVAAAMFMTYGGETIYLFSGSDRNYKKYAGPHLMQWEVIKKALEEGVSFYNFYGTHPVELPGEKGVYEFKRGFRGEFIEYVGTFAKPLDMAGKLYLSRMKYHEFGELS